MSFLCPVTHLLVLERDSRFGEKYCASELDPQMQTKRQIVGSSESWMLQGIYLKLSNKRKWEWSGVNVKESRWSTRWDEKAITVSLWSVQSMCAKFIGLGLPGINPTSFNSSWYSFFFVLPRRHKTWSWTTELRFLFMGLLQVFAWAIEGPGEVERGT